MKQAFVSKFFHNNTTTTLNAALYSVNAVNVHFLMDSVFAEPYFIFFLLAPLLGHDMSMARCKTKKNRHHLYQCFHTLGKEWEEWFRT